MKKNLISVLILALVFANFLLTAILMFSVLPQTKKANNLIDKVCQAIDLDLNSGAASGLDSIPVDQREEYHVNGGSDIPVTLASNGDGKSHYAVVKVSLVMNKGADNYKKYNQEFLNGQDTTIQSKLTQVISSYTVDEMRDQAKKQEMQDVVLQEMQSLFGANYIIAVNFSRINVE